MLIHPITSLPSHKLLLRPDLLLILLSQGGKSSPVPDEDAWLGCGLDRSPFCAEHV